ncbi:hypothetical protein ANCCEY_03418 [Ancylostoma ceylanicum]|uniref:Mitochondrial carrier protein n=1 Tax=Ancylostoma ceylanicum TaxID=53326 RepID=A0A0D6M0A6_9BILA|nr:hypothetical protein ANCCEY_03418 [Ancylostoma ceylanicum]
MIGDDELSIVAGRCNQGMLKVIEWDHMNLAVFYPAALTSTWAVRTVLYPLAVLRSRLQLQKQHTVYKNTLDAFINISKKEGFRGLYRGFWVTVPQIGTSFIYATVYEKLRAVLNQDFGINSVAGISSLAGGAASFASQSIFVPTDIIAQYMMVYYKADKFISGNDKAVIEYMRRRTTDSSGLLLLDQAVAAALGGACSTVCTNPMEMFRIRLQVHRTDYRDTLARMIRNEKYYVFTKGLTPRSVVKSRLQLQRQNNVYRGMRHAFTEILKVEGMGALYRGFWMTLPQLSASFLYSSTYERVRDLLQVHIGIKNHSLVSALAGGIASPCAQLVFVPTDIVAQHMMVHNNPEAFGGSRKNVAVASAVRNDGLEGRRTLGLRVVRAVYKVTEIQRGVKPKSPAEVDNRNFFLDQAVSGSIGGIASACVTNPLEMLRIRLQVHRTNYTDTIRRLWRYEGSKVFTKGLAPRVVSNAMYSCMVMLAYETVKKVSVLPEYRDHVVW